MNLPLGHKGTGLLLCCVTSLSDHRVQQLSFSFPDGVLFTWGIRVLNAEAPLSQALGGLPSQEISSSPGTGAIRRLGSGPQVPESFHCCRQASCLHRSPRGTAGLHPSPVREGRSAPGRQGYCHLSESVLALPPYPRESWQPLLSATAITFWEELTGFSLKNSTDCMGVLVYVCVHSLHVHDLNPCTAHQHWTLVSGTRHRGTNILDEVVHGAAGSGADPEGNTSACWPEVPGSELMRPPSCPRVSTLSLTALQPGPHLMPSLQHLGLPVQGPVPGVPSPALWSGEKAAWDWTE